MDNQPSRIFLSLLTSLLLLVAFYRFPWVIFVSFIPLLYACLYKNPPGSTVFRNGFVSGFIFSGGLLYWILALDAPVKAWLWLGMILLFAYFGIIFGISFWIISLNRKTSFRILVIPLVWVSIEFLRSLSFEVGFPWGTLGYSIAQYLPLLQLVEFTGIAGISFFIMLVNSLAFYAVIEKKWKYAVIAGLVILLVYVEGKIILKNTNYLPELKIAVIQPNIQPEIKQKGEYEYRKETLYRLSREAGKCDLLVWPESAVPGYFNFKGKIRDEIESIIDSLNIPVIFGSGRLEPPYVYNSSFLVFPGEGIKGYYDKVYLVPFGERLPFDDIFPGLKKLSFGQGDFSPGNGYKVFHLNEKANFSVLICFESIFPRISGRNVREGANFIINITDDCWFGQTAGPYQHAQFAMIRAIEYRVPIVRCGNTGISYFATPKGELRYRTSLFTQKVLVDNIPLRTKLTIYAKYGDWFAWMCLIILLSLGIKKLFNFRKRKPI